MALCVLGEDMWQQNKEDETDLHSLLELQRMGDKEGEPCHAHSPPPPPPLGWQQDKPKRRYVPPSFPLCITYLEEGKENIHTLCYIQPWGNAEERETEGGGEEAVTRRPKTKRGLPSGRGKKIEKGTPLLLAKWI